MNRTKLHLCRYTQLEHMNVRRARGSVGVWRRDVSMEVRVG